MKPRILALLGLLAFSDFPAMAQTAASATKGLKPAWHNQEGFAAQPYAHDFIQWQQALLEDVNGLRAAIQSNPSGHLPELLDPENKGKLIKAFERSIDPGPNGIYTMTLIADAFRNSRNRDVWAPGSTFIYLALGTKQDLRSGEFGTVAIGYGGKFKHQQREVELLYVFPGDPSRISPEQLPQDPLYGSCFPGLHVPPLGVVERDACPAMVFVRNGDGRWVLFSMSKEFSAMIQRITMLQIS